MQHANNLVNSLITYGWLSPNLAIQRRLSHWLLTRPYLSCDQWFNRYWNQPGLARAYSRELIQFLYTHLQEYTGLEVGRLQPSDRLVDDLQFPSICWFDWGLTLCTDFYDAFGVDISDQFDEGCLETCADLVDFLNFALDSTERNCPVVSLGDGVTWGIV